MPITLSCYNNLNNLISLRVLLVYILYSKAFSVFFIAKDLFFPSILSIAATTIPYAPYPIFSKTEFEYRYYPRAGYMRIICTCA